MTVLTWDAIGARLYETGVDRGVLYPSSGSGVVWNGLISVEETPSGGEVESFYYDGDKYMDVISSEDFQAAITAYSSPVEFLTADGLATLAPGLFATGQPRTTFGVCYRTKIGNDVSADLGYKLHLIYNVTASPTQKQNRSNDTQQNPLELQWTINAVPPIASTYKSTAHFVINSIYANATKLANLEALLYGTVAVNAALPTQATVISTLT